MLYDCETEEKIHEFLEDLKKNKPFVFHKAERVLRFLYKTVNVDYFEVKEHELDNGNKDKNRIKVLKENIYKFYVNENQGILDNFIKICNDKDSKFFVKFYQEIETFLDMSENHLFFAYSPYKYIFNMYVMMKGYEVYSDDFDNYKTIVEDFSNFFIKSIFNLSNINNSYLDTPITFLSKKKTAIDNLLYIKEYKDLPLMKEILQNTLNEINIKYTTVLYDLYPEILKSFRILNDSVENLRKDGYEVDNTLIKQIKNDLLGILKTKSYSNDSDAFGIRKQCLFVAPILLKGNRYTFVKERINQIETNTGFMTEMMDYISGLDYNFFDMLSYRSKNLTDSFIDCMEKVFNSDTYYELVSKFKDIKKACDIYIENPEEALTLIKDLDSDKHKEVIDGKKIYSYSSENADKTILERTIILHKELLQFAPSEDDYIYIHSSVKHNNITIEKFIQIIQDQINENKSKSYDTMVRLVEENKAQEEPEVPKKTKGLGSIFARKNNNN